MLNASTALQGNVSVPLKCETAVLQDQLELNKFIQLLKDEGVKSYLEIGSKHGGSLWRVANALPVGSKIVAVDLPHGDMSFKESQPHLEACVDKLFELGYAASLYLGDSTDKKMVALIAEWAPFDAVFIDANHTEPFVRQDWANYGPMARIVAFHDIGWQARPEPSKKMPIEVPKVWNEIKQDYRHIEIRQCPRDNGIGVLWRS
jgi:predicted O-methyltransferase YrrM